MILDLFIDPKLKIWRFAFIVVAILSTTLSQSFFVFGKNMEVSTESIYAFGILFAFCVLIVISINVYFLAPKYLSQKDYASYVLILFMLTLALVFIKWRGEAYLFEKVNVEKHWNSITILDGLSNMMLYFVCIASTSIGIVFRKMLDDKKKIENLESKKLKGSIDKIKNSVQSSFLITTLDNISQMVASKPALASATIYKLSELLRYQLYDSTRTKVLLASEIDFIRKYLQLHQQNTDENFLFEIAIDGNAQKLIRPTTFTPLFEELIRLTPQKIIANFTIENEKISTKIVVCGNHFSEETVSETTQKLEWIDKTIQISRQNTKRLQIQLTVC